MTSRTLVKNLAAATDGPVTVSGWVDTVRDQKKVQFIVLRDETGAVQLVHPRTDTGEEPTPDPIAEQISALTTGTFLTVVGELKHDERVKLGGLEVKIETLDVAGAALDMPIAEDSSVDKRLDWRFLDLRRPEQNLLFRVQTTFLHALRTWWVEHDYIEIHTPKLMASASESRAELFEVGYFEGTAYLAQSPQFFKQMAQPAGFGKVFEVAPAFRADPSFTSRHATEFISVDAEISWIDSHEDVMRMHEELLVGRPHRRQGEARRRDRGRVRHRGDRADDAVPPHPARRGQAHRRRARLRRAARRRRHGPRGRAPDLRVRARRPTGTSSCSSPTTPRASGRSTTCVTRTTRRSRTATT